MLPARFTVQQVSLQFLVNLELFYAVQDNLLCQSVGFFYDRQHADIAAQAMEQTVGSTVGSRQAMLESLAEIIFVSAMYRIQSVHNVLDIKSLAKLLRE